MAREPRTVIAIDVGTTAVRVLAARVPSQGDFEIVALGQSQSLGVRRGIVTNVDEASYAIRGALEDAGIERRIRDADVYVGVGGKHIASSNNTGVTEVSRADGQVTEKDVARAVLAARQTQLLEEVVLVHQVPRGFLIDGYRCRRNPVGMRGMTAHAETHLVTAGAIEVKNARKAVEMAGLAVDHIVVNAIASSHAVLHREEREAGVVMLDIGGGTTDIVVCHEGSIAHTSALPLGGNQIANDIGVALNTALHVGERILIEHGTASAEGVDLLEELTAPCFGLTGYRRYRRQYLYDVVRLRVTELLQLGLGCAKEGAPGLPKHAGVVITGGVANLPGITKLAEKVLGRPARVGTPPHQQYAPETLKNAAFASVIGILELDSDPLFAPVPAEPAARTNGSWLRPALEALRPLAKG
jgi:cell division protein FtsA